jgi:50S ribosomal protein L16 3-hydroxylase
MANNPLPLLGGLTPDDFLREYWQKKPFLIRNAIHDFSSSITVDDLFKLAADESIESRLVFEKDGEYPWQVMHGPLENIDTLALPETHWSLLVQTVDQHLKSMTLLLSRFNFIPNWRVDDLMISYAPEGGSVGPHLDSYDVFLLQAQGSRRWLINTEKYNDKDFIPDLDLRIIDNFNATQEWILEPGDMLYLPPGIAHHGIAMNECMTYSIGFRAPDQNELLTYFIEDRLENITSTIYSDPDLETQVHPGEIHHDNLVQLRALMKAPFSEENELNIWIGSYLTRAPDATFEDIDELELKPGEVKLLLEQAGEFTKNPAYRTAFINHADKFILFVNGKHYILPQSCVNFVHELTESSCVSHNTVKDLETNELIYTLTDLYNMGLFHD